LSAGSENHDVAMISACCLSCNTRVPKCNSIRSRPGRIVPETYSRVVHDTENGPKCAPMASYREQTVEIALSSRPNQKLPR